MPKAGSTSLFHFLADSHLFRIFESKESNFLKNDNFLMSEYVKIFHDHSSLSSDKPFFEITPSYIFDEVFFKNLEHFDPEETFVFLVLRDPIRRALSHYVHDLRLGQCDYLPADIIAPENINTSPYLNYSKFADFIEPFRALSFGKIYTLQEIEENNGADLLEDIRQKFFSKTPATSFGEQFGKLPSNNGAGLVPFVTRVESNTRVTLNGDQLDVMAGSYILERVRIPYSYDYEIIRPSSEVQQLALDRLVSLSGAPIHFKCEDLIELRQFTFKREYALLRDLNVNQVEDSDISYEPVVSRLTYVR